MSTFLVMIVTKCRFRLLCYHSSTCLATYVGSFMHLGTFSYNLFIYSFIYLIFILRQNNFTWSVGL